MACVHLVSDPLLGTLLFHKHLTKLFCNSAYSKVTQVEQKTIKTDTRLIIVKPPPCGTVNSNVNDVLTCQDPSRLTVTYLDPQARIHHHTFNPLLARIAINVLNVFFGGDRRCRSSHLISYRHPI